MTQCLLQGGFDTRVMMLNRFTACILLGSRVIILPPSLLSLSSLGIDLTVVLDRTFLHLFLASFTSFAL